jgi:transposase
VPSHKADERNQEKGGRSATERDEFLRAAWRVREMIERRGCQLLYLPGYSPDYNPIEEAFSKIKEILRRACARTRETLLEALGEALSAVSIRDAQGFFEHAGYRPMGQLL